MDDQPAPPSFTITDSDGEFPAVQRPSLLSSLGISGWLRIGGWLVAAGLALGSAWAQVMQLGTSVPADQLEYAFRLSYDGWGRPTITTHDPLDFSMASGPNFGVLLCLAAAALVVGAVLDWLPHRFRWQPSGRIVSGLAAAFLLAVALCEVVTNLPYRHSFGTPSETLSFGPAPWLAGAGCLIAALGCLLPHQAEDPAADPLDAVPNTVPTEYPLLVE